MFKFGLTHTHTSKYVLYMIQSMSMCNVAYEIY